MYSHGKIKNLNDFFKSLSLRETKSVFFYRINSFNEEIDEFILKYYEAARHRGVIIEDGIKNPSEENLSYYSEIMGKNFEMNLFFVEKSISKWLPRMNEIQKKNISKSIYDSLEFMKKSGKNDNILKNAYIKFMCWLYYKFERILSQLGDEDIPKIIYEGRITNHELILLSILSKSGCDVVLLEYLGDDNYKKFDPNSVLSIELEVKNKEEFPENYNLKKIGKRYEKILNRKLIYGEIPTVLNYTNAWIEGKIFDNILKEENNRGIDGKFFYNVFVEINGVEDKTTYVNDLYQFYINLRNLKRKILILENNIEKPSVEEIKEISRSNYKDYYQMLRDLKKNIDYNGDKLIKNLASKAFLDTMFEEIDGGEDNLNKLLNKGVYLLSLFKRYQYELFAGWKKGDIPSLIFLGNIDDEHEVLFFKMMSKLPVDVIILNPENPQGGIIKDRFLYKIDYVESLKLNSFPRDNSHIEIATAAYHAERELDTLMYNDSNMFRNKQYSKGNSIVLKTIYEEVFLLWDEEVKFRPNFSVNDDTVSIPVILSKISGVKDGNINEYWKNIKSLITNDTFLIKSAPFIKKEDYNPIKQYAVNFFRNNKLRKNEIKANKEYKYSYLRTEIQDYILDKLEILINDRLIKGTFESGVEYSIIATVLNMPTNILRLIQNFDFTKKNPKIIYINTSEKIISLEDSILIAFLSLIGFDIVFFVPTGYETIEKYFNGPYIEEYQVGQYIYDMEVPNFRGRQENKKSILREILFRI